MSEHVSAQYGEDPGSTRQPGPASDRGSLEVELQTGAPVEKPLSRDEGVVEADAPTVISRPHPHSGGAPTATPSPPNEGYDGSAGEIGRALVGQRLGHFQIEAFVGGGGMGAVFRAVDTTLNRVVALKILSPSQATDTETVRRFLNEAQSAARLDHDNIARVHYVGEDKGLHFIVFEFIEGVNVRDLVGAQGHLDLADAVSYILQIVHALEHSWDRDVVHRDIKPSNILITPSRQAKLVDMGLARLHDVERASDELTASGVTLGTFDYISPEQARDPRNADVRSDIYSLGCTFYFMLTGQPPFPEGTVLQKLLRHQGDVATDPREFNPSIPDDVCDVLYRMLAKDPLQRYQSASELKNGLGRLADVLRLDVIGAVPLGASIELDGGESLIARSLPWLIPSVCLVLVFAGLEWAAIVNRDFVFAPIGKSFSAGGMQEPARDSFAAPTLQQSEQQPLDSGGDSAERATMDTPSIEPEGGLINGRIEMDTAPNEAANSIKATENPLNVDSVPQTDEAGLDGATLEREEFDQDASEVGLPDGADTRLRRESKSGSGEVP